MALEYNDTLPVPDSFLFVKLKFVMFDNIERCILMNIFLTASGLEEIYTSGKIVAKYLENI